MMRLLPLLSMVLCGCAGPLVPFSPRPRVHRPAPPAPKRARCADPADARPRDLEVRIASLRQHPLGWLIVRVELQNVGRQPLTVLAPQDGSTEGWSDPSFLIEVLPRQWQSSPRARPRGSGHVVRYTHDDFRALAPGESTRFRVLAALRPLGKGRYRLRVRYRVRPDRYPEKGEYKVPSRRGTAFTSWPPGVFVGEVTSRPVPFRRR